MPTAGSRSDRPVIVFDGLCNLCNHSVDFLVRHDKSGIFALAANQSAAAERLLGAASEELDTIVLVEDRRVYRRSTAVLRIARRLPMPWRLFYVGIIVPRPLRDLLYRVIAANRYKWFGRRDSCRLPTAEEAARFLD